MHYALKDVLYPLHMKTRGNVCFASCDKYCCSGYKILWNACKRKRFGNWFFKWILLWLLFTLASKLLSDDCLDFVDLVEVLIQGHPHIVAKYIGSKQLLQQRLCFLCHSSWEVHIVASAVVSFVNNYRLNASDFVRSYREVIWRRRQCFQA